MGKLSLPVPASLTHLLHQPFLEVRSHTSKTQLKKINIETIQPGDVLIHHGYTIHGAPGNKSMSHQRRGYITRWMGDDVTFDDRPGTIHPGWVKTGHDCGLVKGQSMDCELHPTCYEE